jgi:hypothetical protein
VNLIENAPRGDHPHDGGLPRTRRHLAGIPTKGLVPALSLLLIAGLVQRNLDPLHKITPRFIEKDDRFGCFELSEEEPEAAAIPSPIAQ